MQIPIHCIDFPCKLVSTGQNVICRGGDETECREMNDKNNNQVREESR